MEWSNESVLEFLRLYEQESVIWNAKHLKHKDRNAVYDAWSNIQKSFSLQCTIQELKKKKESLMSTFRPLLSKVKASMGTGSGADDIYKPNWFAYETMAKFLVGVSQPRSTISTQDLEDTSTSVDMCNTENSTENRSVEENLDISTSCSMDSSYTPSNKRNCKKRKFDSSEVENRMEDAYKIMKTVCEKQKKNVCQLYGELLGEKLNEFDKKTQYFLMHEIDNLIFKTKFQTENTSQPIQPNYRLENLQQNVPSASYNPYNYPASIYSTSPYYSQPSAGVNTDEPNASNIQHGYQ